MFGFCFDVDVLCCEIDVCCVVFDGNGVYWMKFVLVKDGMIEIVVVLFKLLFVGLVGVMFVLVYGFVLICVSDVLLLYKIMCCVEYDCVW